MLLTAVIAALPFRGVHLLCFLRTLAHLHDLLLSATPFERKLTLGCENESDQIESSQCFPSMKLRTSSTLSGLSDAAKA